MRRIDGSWRARARVRSAQPVGNKTYAVHVTASESPFTSFEPVLACGDGRIAGEIVLHERNLAGQNLRRAGGLGERARARGVWSFCPSPRARTLRVDATVRASLASVDPFGHRRRETSRGSDDEPQIGSTSAFVGPPTFTLRLADNKFGLPGAWQLALQRQRDRTSHLFSCVWSLTSRVARRAHHDLREDVDTQAQQPG